MRLSGSDLANATTGPLPASASSSSLPHPSTGPPATAGRAAPPPLPRAEPAPIPVPRFGTGSVLFGAQPVAAVATAAPAANLVFEPDPEAKNRMTFIILGVLLGPIGAHNFYAGYLGKAFTQLLITVVTLGFASPMTWVWAVIEVWTVDRDKKGIKFRS